MSKFQFHIISHVLYVTFLLDTLEIDYINGFVKIVNYALVWVLMHNNINSRFIKTYSGVDAQSSGSFSTIFTLPTSPYKIF
jgi:hypothetical protein